MSWVDVLLLLLMMMMMKDQFLIFMITSTFDRNLLANFISLFLFPTARQKCCPDNECYDLCRPWTSLTRPVPPPRCIDEPATFLLTNRY